MILKKLLPFLICLIADFAVAQDIQIDRIDVRGNKVIVWYTLQDSNYDRKYLINIFSSLDGFANPLTKVKGDVGMDVKPGTEKKITWDIIAELGAFKGNLTFKITGSIQIPFVNLSSFKGGHIFKRGKSYPIAWVSGNPDGRVNLELYNNKELVWSANNLPNTGKYDWTVAAKAKKSRNYRLKFINATDPTDFQFTSSFAIKPRTPTFLKAAGAVVVLGAGVIFIGGKSTGSSSNPLPDPPSSPGN